LEGDNKMSDWKFIPGTENELGFLTFNVVEKVNLFTKPTLFQIIIDNLTHYQENKNLIIAGYIIMPNHMHIFCAGSEKYKLKETIHLFKHSTTSEIIKELQSLMRYKDIAIFQKTAKYSNKKTDYKIWSESDHPNIVTSKQMFDRLLSHMHDNPVRKGYVSKPQHWLYSSARNYLFDDHSILKVECIK